MTILEQCLASGDLSCKVVFISSDKNERIRVMDLRKRQTQQASHPRNDETASVEKDVKAKPRSYRYIFLATFALASSLVVTFYFPKSLDLLFGGKTKLSFQIDTMFHHKDYCRIRGIGFNLNLLKDLWGLVNLTKVL